MKVGVLEAKLLPCSGRLHRHLGAGGGGGGGLKGFLKTELYPVGAMLTCQLHGRMKQTHARQTAQSKNVRQGILSLLPVIAVI